MKNFFLIFASVLALSACSVMPSSQGTTQATVAANAEKLRLAMIDPDLATLNALVATEVSYGHSSGKIDNKSVFIGDLMNGSSDFVTISISNQTITVTQNTAVVRHALVGTLNDKGKTVDLKLNILQIWQQQGGDWKLLARQAMR